MKNINFYKQAICLFSLLAMGLISTSNISARTINNFPPQNFWVIDQTTSQYTIHDGVQYNLNGIVGYKVDTIYKNGVEKYEIRLTDTIPYMTVALWDKSHKIDLNQDFEMHFKLWFGTGRVNFPRVADGICFVMHTQDSATTNGLIAGMQQNLGYGWNGYADCGGSDSKISPSFAIEWDTEYNVSYEGYFQSSSSMHHISYLKNAYISALDGTGQPMQNNWGSVAINDWFDCKIHWRKSFIDSVPVWDMLTYMQEKNPNDPQWNHLLLRDSMRFYSLDEVITGIELDSNCQALVTWGVTSATCMSANRHRIQFDSLIVGDMLPRDSIKTDTAHIYIENFGTSHLPLSGGDTIETTCGLITIPPTDTIYYPHLICGVSNPIIITLSGVDTAGAEWYLLKDGSYTNIPSGFISLTDSILRTYDTVRVRLVLNGDTTYFVFNKGVTPLLNYFMDNRDSLGFVGVGGAKKLDTTYQSVALPGDIFSCIFIDSYDSSKYAIPPHIVDSSKTLEFELLTDTFCTATRTTSITLINTCDTLCNNDNITLSFEGFCACDSLSYYFVANPPPARPFFTISYGGLIWVKSTSGIGISRVEWSKDGGAVSSLNFSSEDSVSIRISLPCTGKDELVHYNVCATLEDNTRCCGTVSVPYKCNDYSYVVIDKDLTTIDLEVDSRLNITAGLLQLPNPISPLRVSIYDNFGMEVQIISNSNPTGLLSYFNPSVTGLVAGTYYVVFQIEDETYAILFIKQ